MNLLYWTRCRLVPFLAISIIIPFISGCSSLSAPIVVASGTGIGYVLLQSHARTGKEYWNDQQLDRAITRAINKDKILRTEYGNTKHINVTVFNDIVLLTGEAPVENQIARIIDLANSFSASRQVINRIRSAK